LSRTEDSTFGGSASVGVGLGIFSVSVGGGGFSGSESVRKSLFDLKPTRAAPRKTIMSCRI
jgi:hypothetical protein